MKNILTKNGNERESSMDNYLQRVVRTLTYEICDDIGVVIANGRQPCNNDSTVLDSRSREREESHARSQLWLAVLTRTNASWGSPIRYTFT